MLRRITQGAAKSLCPLSRVDSMFAETALGRGVTGDGRL